MSVIVPHFSQFLNANLNVYVALETNFQAHDQMKGFEKGPHSFIAMEEFRAS